MSNPRNKQGTNESIPDLGIDLTGLGSKLSTTAKTLFVMGKNAAGAKDIPNNHPAKSAIISFVFVNALTSRLNDIFLNLPNTRGIRDLVEAGLSKLKAASPPVKTNPTTNQYNVYSSKFVESSTSVSQNLDTQQALRNDYLALRQREESYVTSAVETIVNSPDPAMEAKKLSISPEILSELAGTLRNSRKKVNASQYKNELRDNEFLNQYKKLENLSFNLNNLNTASHSKQTELNNLWEQIKVLLSPVDKKTLEGNQDRISPE